MCVLKGNIVNGSESMTGVKYKGEFYSPLDLALEAYDYFMKNKIDVANEILDLMEQCMDEDYLDGYGVLLSSILYDGMVARMEHRYHSNKRKQL